MSPTDDRVDAIAYAMDRPRPDDVIPSRALDPLPLRTERYYSPLTDRMEFRTTLGGSHAVTTQMVVYDQMRDMRRVAEEISRQHSRMYAEVIKRQIYEQMIQQGTAVSRERYIRSYAEDVFSHARDFLWGRDGKKIERNDEKIVALSSLSHREINDNGWIANMLETTNMIWNEGEAMSHCMGNAYMGKIVNGEYLAYHVTAPDGSRFPKSGFTLGYKKNDGTWKFDQLKGKKNSVHYCKEPELLAFVDYITTKIGASIAVREKISRFRPEWYGICTS